MGSKESKKKINKATKFSFKKARKRNFKPTHEIYSNVKWKKSQVKKVIRKKKLSPIFLPSDKQGGCSIVECPICRYFFPVVNLTACCKKPICTECYLQICPQLISESSDRCPWCRKSFFSISYKEKYRKRFLKQQNNKRNEKLLKLEKKAQKNEREEFEKEREKVIKFLLEIKEKEEKKGEYDRFRDDEEKKQKRREFIKEIFEQQKRNQENSTDQNNFNFNFNFEDNNQVIQTIGEIEETQQNEQENQEEEININNLYDYLRNPRRLSQLQANQLNNLMIEEAIRLSTRQN
ncbi:protein sip5 [Anaeramoeba flamelloides]|uniref:Protein sip5 n=1 Tax=Anaeramoeba flamelloides TaxID=1746091 RepID=A0AAV7Z7K0_9EUKA|nr:protein sip5 [Anaeramoeba flamelloides]